jgi:hypothetical protein
MRDIEIRVTQEGLRVVARDSDGRQAVLDFLREIDPAVEAIGRAVRLPRPCGDAA